MNKPVGTWLLACCALVAAMVVTGGVTRLTHSGLSIVEWKPVVGVVPPLSEADWTAEFVKYQASPEYKLANAGMSRADFKSIFWMEYFHRLLGRIAGLTFVLPFVFFAATKRLEKDLLPKLGAVALLWALQGFLGWFMVRSGLVNEPHVSPYRLTIHLLAACLLYAAMFQTALSALLPAPEREFRSWLRHLSSMMVALVFVTIASGGLVAGWKAGFSFNTFPTMDGYWLPPSLWELKPFALNFLANLATIQFDHRLLALVLVAGAAALRLAGRAAAPRARLSLNALAVAAGLQALLGVLTLLYRVPVPLAAAHQANALLLLSAALLVRREFSR